MTDDARRAVAESQRRLVDALVAGGPPPAGFDPVGLALARRTLVGKRRRSLERGWPGLAGVPGFAGHFADYARLTALPAGGDAVPFYRCLSRGNHLTDAARLEMLTFRATLRWVAVVRLAGRPRFAVAVRVGRARVWTIRI